MIFKYFSRKEVIFQILAGVLLLYPLGLILKRLYIGVNFPMELEVREGINWLHVLALKEGISIYDHDHVAYFASHGVMDSLLKFLISSVFPFLSSQVVTRFFCITLPLCLFYMTSQIFKPSSVRWPLALASAVLIYMGLTDLNAFNMLMGRPDPLYLSFAALQGGLTAKYFFEKKASVLSLIIYQIIVCVQIFTIWRSLPTCGLMWLVAAVSLSNWTYFLKLAFSSLAMFILFYVGLVFAFSAGDFHNFYQHFIGIFLDANYVKFAPGVQFAIVPVDVFNNTARLIDNLLPVGIPVFLLGLSLFFKKITISKKMLVAFWFLIALCYLIYSYATFKNSAGAGIYYLSPSIVVTWLFAFILCQVAVKEKYGFQVLFLFLVYLVFVPDWSALKNLNNELDQRFAATQVFREQLEKLDNEGLLMSEDLHLFRKKMNGAVVDNGDGVEDLTTLNYFDQKFHEVGRRFFAEVASGKYKYYLTGGVQSRQTTQYLIQNYHTVAIAPDYPSYNSNGARHNGQCANPINCPMIHEKN